MEQIEIKKKKKKEKCIGKQEAELTNICIRIRIESENLWKIKSDFVSVFQTLVRQFMLHIRTSLEGFSAINIIKKFSKFSAPSTGR